MDLKGFIRPDGSIGFRNHLLVLPSVACSTHVASMIGKHHKDVVSIIHQHGCAQVGEDREQTARTLIGIGRNPNVGAVLVVGLGCETISAKYIAEEIASTGKPVEMVIVQEAGGTGRATELGNNKVRLLLEDITSLEREPVGWEAVILGTKCGGSDACSGLSANPAVGFVSDRVVEAGGTVILAETTEFIGAEHLLMERAANEEIGREIEKIVTKVEQRAFSLGVDIRGANPTPGNIEGGITTIEEKSLGCIRKGGTTPINEVLRYAQKPTKRGLVVMDTPGNDVETVTGITAGGAQVVIFTTGRGTPLGSPIAPVIKVATNTQMYERMKDNMDINAGTIIDGMDTIEQVGNEIWNKLIAVLNGEETRTEYWGHREFGINRLSSSF